MARYISGRGSEQPSQPDFEWGGWAIAFLGLAFWDEEGIAAWAVLANGRYAEREDRGECHD
jgi:hypothetical protein